MNPIGPRQPSEAIPLRRSLRRHRNPKPLLLPHLLELQNPRLHRNPKIRRMPHPAHVPSRTTHVLHRPHRHRRPVDTWHCNGRVVQVQDVEVSRAGVILPPRHEADEEVVVADAAEELVVVLGAHVVDEAGVGCPVGVEVAGAAGEGAGSGFAVVVAQRMRGVVPGPGGGHDGRLEGGRAPARVEGAEEADDAGDMGARHGCARDHVVRGGPVVLR